MNGVGANVRQRLATVTVGRIQQGVAHVRSATVKTKLSGAVADSGTVQALTSLAMAPKPRCRVAPGDFAPEALARSGRGDFHLSGSSVNVSRHVALAALPKEVTVTCLSVVLASVMVPS